MRRDMLFAGQLSRLDRRDDFERSVRMCRLYDELPLSLMWVSPTGWELCVERVSEDRRTFVRSEVRWLWKRHGCRGALVEDGRSLEWEAAA